MPDLERFYRAACLESLPGLVKRRDGDVRAFDDSVIRNRQRYVQYELAAARICIDARDADKRRIDGRRAKTMGILDGHGALDQFRRVQAGASAQAAETTPFTSSTKEPRARFSGSRCRAPAARASRTFSHSAATAC